MPEVNLSDELRKRLHDDFYNTVPRPPGDNELTVNMLAKEMGITKKSARKTLEEQVEKGIMYVRKNGMNQEGTSTCYVYGYKD